MKDNNFFNLDQLKLTFFYEADCFNLNQLEANIDLNWGWYISIWTNWRLTFFLWGWQFQSEADTFQSGANWWLTFSEADTFNLYQLEADNFYEDDCFNLNQLRGWQSFCGADHYSSLRHLWRLTSLFWGWHEADNYFLRLTCFNLGANNHLLGLTCFNLEADMRLTIISWGWHVSIWRLTWGWHVSIWRLAIIFWGWPFLSEPTGRLTIFF